MECPFCREEIKDDAIKCKHCGSQLDQSAPATVSSGAGAATFEQGAFSYYLAALRKYVNFSGRSRRKEYWFFLLFNTLIAFVIGIIDAMVMVSTPEAIGVLGLLYNLAVLLPSIAISVRRLHDIDRSGWWLLIALIPLVGAIVLIVWACTESEEGENKYGPNPMYHKA